MTHDLLKIARKCESLDNAGGCGYAAHECFRESKEALRAAHEEIQLLRDKNSALTQELDECGMLEKTLRELFKRHESESSRIKLSCIKCGGTDIYTVFHQKLECAYFSRNTSSSEHLHRTCRTCQYDWLDTPLDAVESAMKEGK